MYVLTPIAEIKIDSIVIDKRINTSWFFDDKYIITLNIPSAIEKDRIQNYQVSQKDYYRLTLNKKYNFTFCKVEGKSGWFLKGSRI